MTGGSTVYATSAHGPLVGQPLPLFTLRNSCGRQVRLWDFKQRRPVVLLFIHSGHCQLCLAAVRELAARREDLAELRAAVLVIVSEAPEVLADLRERLGIPFTLLADEDGTVAARYLSSERDEPAPTGLFVADRYGECGLAATAAEASDLPRADAVLAELAHAAQNTCACLVPAWPEISQC